MEFPLTFWHLSLLLAVAAIILLATAELTSPHYGRTNLSIDYRKLKNVALITGILSLATFAIHIYQIIAMQ